MSQNSEYEKMAEYRRQKEGWDCADGTPDEDHDWKYVSDWYGDPDVINGTCTIYYKFCRVCGKEAEWDGSGHHEID